MIGVRAQWRQRALMMRKCRDRSVVRYKRRSPNGDHWESTPPQLTAMETKTTTHSNGDATAVTNANIASAAAAAAPTAGVAVAAAVPMGLERISIPGSIRKKPNPAYVAGRGMQRKAVIVLHEVRAAAAGWLLGLRCGCSGRRKRRSQWLVPVVVAARVAVVGRDSSGSAAGIRVVWRRIHGRRAGQRKRQREQGSTRLIASDLTWLEPAQLHLLSHPSLTRPRSSRAARV